MHPSGISLLPQLDAERPDGLVEVGHVVGRGGDLDAADGAVGVDAERAGRLPAVAALGGAVPDVLLLAELEGLVERQGAEDVPGARGGQPPAGVHLALVVDDDLDLPVAADLDDPALRGLGRRVRHGHAVQLVLVLGRDGRQGLERLFGDWRGWSVGEMFST